jgi:hypothetical protein
MHVNDWQDIVLAISFAAFNVALIPSMISDQKPAIGTSLLTTTFLIPGLVVYISLSLWYSAIMTAINISFWATLLIQKYLQTRTKAKATD